MAATRVLPTSDLWFTTATNNILLLCLTGVKTRQCHGELNEMNCRLYRTLLLPLMLLISWRWMMSNADIQCASCIVAIATWRQFKLKCEQLRQQYSPTATACRRNMHDKWHRRSRHNKKLSCRRDSARRQSLLRSRSFKVTDFGSNRKPICDFLLVNRPICIVSRTVSGLSQSIYQIIALERGACL